MSNIFEKYKEDFLQYIRNEENIKIVYLFGSYADGTYNENSDIDIAVIYKGEMDEYDHAGKSLDVSKVFNYIHVDYIDLEKVNVFLQFEILKKGKLIYCEDEDYLIDFTRKVQEQYIEMDYERQKYFEMEQNRIEEKNINLKEILCYIQKVTEGDKKEILTNRLVMNSLENNLRKAIQIMIDLASDVVSKNRLRVCTTYYQTVERLVENNY